MKKNAQNIRAYVIDSSVLMRRILSSMLQKEEGVIMMGASGNYDSEHVITNLEKHQPDILYLGIDGVESEAMILFRKLRTSNPDLNIILLTPLNKEGAKVAIHGLKEGAIDYVTKPEKSKGIILAEKHFHKRAIPLLNVITKLNRKKSSDSAFSADRTISKDFFQNVGRMTPSNIELVAIGSCIGGVSSIFQILPTLPESLSVPIIIVQHMPKIYTKIFSKMLNDITSLNVIEAKNGSLLKPGTIYVAPGGFHTTIRCESGQRRIELHKGPKEHKCRPSIDVMLRSAVQEFGDSVLGVFLSGGGNDGALGAFKILENGGAILLESRESALISEMARKVKILNSDIKEVSAEKMSSEIVAMLDAVSHQRKNQFKRQVTNSSGRIQAVSKPD